MAGDVAPDALLQRASELRQAGRVGEAIAAYEALLRARPDLPDSWYNLARLQRQARRFDSALESYRQALRRGVREPEEVHLNRAVILAEDLARARDAEAELKAALDRNPRFVPALLNLGNLREDQGERAGARLAYEQVLALDADNFIALSRVAGLAPAGGAGDPLTGRLRDALARADLAAADRADLGFALGQRLDAAGAYDAAFEAYAAANAASRASVGAAGRYDPAAHEALIERLIAAFPDVAPRTARSGGDAPIFICGMFRSGSTLTEQILSRHRAVTAGGELDLLPALIGRFLSPYPQAFAAADAGLIDTLRQTYRDELRRAHPGGGVVTDKRPDNFLHIGLIKTLFPNAKIVHTRRDPLDNCLSIYFLHLHPEMSYALDLQDIAHWYGQYRKLMAHWRKLYPDDIHDLDYDALVADPRRTIAGLLDFCGLDWDEKCLSFHEATNAVRTASAWQVREPLYRRASGRWRNYAAQLAPLRRALPVD